MLRNGRLSTGQLASGVLTQGKFMRTIRRTIRCHSMGAKFLFVHLWLIEFGGVAAL